ncbi:hypothetical protein ROLI_027840 [Roseobacter fucihabitans]|uniref:Uncharacterized protein n=1 Tax=Roseobacter fucihabitans TaxID=1537242 RepID=A0ABZ2BYA9_9RHOB|nr:hypothetical protein [Roseobacter litoralis]MBC6967082.1 hypothetical protein [Roseobacter litoralis]
MKATGSVVCPLTAQGETWQGLEEDAIRTRDARRFMGQGGRVMVGNDAA